MAKKSPLDIMNLMGSAANKKARMAPDADAPYDEEDPLNSIKPKGNKSPASKKVAAMKEQEKGNGFAKGPKVPKSS